MYNEDTLHFKEHTKHCNLFFFKERSTAILTAQNDTKAQTLLKHWPYSKMLESLWYRQIKLEPYLFQSAECTLSDEQWNGSIPKREKKKPSCGCLKPWTHPWKPINHSFLVQLPPPFPGCRLGCHIRKEEDPTWRGRTKDMNIQSSSHSHKSSSCFMKDIVVWFWLSESLEILQNYNRKRHESSVTVLINKVRDFFIWFSSLIRKRFNALSRITLRCWVQQPLGPPSTRHWET